MAQKKERKVVWLEIGKDVTPLKMINEYCEDANVNLFLLGVDYGKLVSGALDEKEMQNYFNNLICSVINFVLKYPKSFKRKLVSAEEQGKLVESKTGKAPQFENYFG